MSTKVGPFSCPGCSGQVVFDRAEQSALHTEPPCEWYSDPNRDPLDIITATRKAMGLPSPHPEDWS